MHFSPKEKYRHDDKARNPGLKLPVTVPTLLPKHPPLAWILAAGDIFIRITAGASSSWLHLDLRAWCYQVTTCFRMGPPSVSFHSYTHHITGSLKTLHHPQYTWLNHFVILVVKYTIWCSSKLNSHLSANDNCLRISYAQNQSSGIVRCFVGFRVRDVSKAHRTVIFGGMSCQTDLLWTGQ